MNEIMFTLKTSGTGLCVLFLAAASLLAAGPAIATDEPAQASRAQAETPALPDDALKPFLGTWFVEETISHEPGGKSFQMQRYILIRWHREHLQIKTFDYLPAYKARDMESDWKGTIAVDQWNQTRQTFTPMPDGTISVGLSGSNGIGNLASRNVWWAAGSLELVQGNDAEQRLRFRTIKGYAPTPKGNAWKPIDRSYVLVSREIDPKHARPAGR
jgi:hypothetical protein